MKLTVQSSRLSEALTALRPVMASRSSLPILGNVLLTATETALVITATNLEQRLSLTIESDVKEEGAATLPYNRLLLAAGAMNGAIELSTDDKNAASLKSGGSSIRLLGLPVDEFPPALARKMDEPPVSIETVTFAELGSTLKKASLFMAVPIMARQVLEGVLIECADKQLVLVATDGRRMVTARLATDADGAFRVTVPAAAVKALTGLCGSTDGLARIQVSNSWVQVSSATWTLDSMVVEQSFPNWKQIMPGTGELKKSIVLNRAAALSALSAAGVTLDDRSRKLAVSAHNGSVVFEADTADIGKSSIAIDRLEKGADFKFSVDSRFFADAIRICDEEQVSVRAADDLSPLVITEAGFTSVTMPMRVG